MREIADVVGAYLFVDMAHVAGLIAAGLYPNPLPYAHVVTTTTHKTLGGPRGGLILSSCGDEELYKRLQSSVFPANQGGPLVHIIAAKAVCFKEALEPAYKEYQANVIKNAKAMVEVFKQRGYDVVSNGTENHLFLKQEDKELLSQYTLLDLYNKINAGSDSELVDKFNFYYMGTLVNATQA